MAVAGGGFSAVLTFFFGLRAFARETQFLGALDGEEFFATEGTLANLFSDLWTYTSGLTSARVRSNNNKNKNKTRTTTTTLPGRLALLSRAGELSSQSVPYLVIELAGEARSSPGSLQG